MSNETENRKKYVSIAKSYLGMKEGSKEHEQILHYFNRAKPQGYKARISDPWCAIFMSACAVQAFGKKNAVTFFPLSASCPRIVTESKAKSIWVEKDSYKPKSGDLILYDWDDSGKGDDKNSPDHVGIVETVRDGKITVIEGNYNDKVKERIIKINGENIRGFATPHFDRIKSVAKKTNKQIAKEVIAGKWGNGKDRKEALEAAGYDYKAVQKEVNKLMKEGEKKK